MKAIGSVEKFVPGLKTGIVSTSSSNKKLLFFSLLMIIGVSSVSAAFEIALTPGWNMVSLPEFQSRPDISTVTESIQGKFSSIWSYENGQWLFFSPESPEFSSLTRMNSGVGYWINMTTGGKLVGTGVKASSSVSLNEGWNFIGFTGSAETNITDLLPASAGGINEIWAFQNGGWKVYDAAHPEISDLKTMVPGGGYWMNTSTSSAINVDIAVPTTTKTVLSQDLEKIFAITSDKVEFIGVPSFIGTLNPNDTLVCPATTLAPDGFIRKILTIEATAVGYLLTTQAATLLEAIQKGSANALERMTANDLDLSRCQFPKGFRLAPRPVGEDTLGTLSFTYELEVEPGQTITFDGSLTVNPEFQVHLELDGWSLSDFSVTYTANSQVSASVTSSWELLAIEKEMTIPNLKLAFNPIVVWVGWIPVVITPEINVVVGFEGSVSANFALEAGLSSVATAGFGYSRADGWRIIQYLETNYSLDPSLNVSATGKLYAGPKLSVYVYGLVGPYVSLNLFGEATYTFEGSPPLEIFVGIEALAGLEMSSNTADFLKMFGIEVTDPLWESPTISYKIQMYPPAAGQVKGLVVDEAGNVVEGVTVTSYPRNLTATTDALGGYSLELPIGHYNRLEYSKTGYYTGKLYDVTIGADMVFDAPQVVMNLIGPPGIISGTVSNALDGQPVAGAKLFFRKGFFNLIGGIVGLATSGSDGAYTSPELEAGNYTVVCDKQGFNTTFFLAYCLSGVTNLNQNASMTPLLQDTSVRVVLTWGETPLDLDSHMTGPLENSTARFHVFYSALGSATVAPYTVLDHDDVTSYGPETITIAQVFPGTYRYSVHDYSNSLSASSTGLANSLARVDVYSGSTLIRAFSVPNQPGTLWTVFEYNSGSITPINTMTYQPSPSSVTRKSVNNSSDGHLLRDLPEK